MMAVRGRWAMAIGYVSVWRLILSTRGSFPFTVRLTLRRQRGLRVRMISSFVLSRWWVAMLGPGGYGPLIGEGIGIGSLINFLLRRPPSVLWFA